MYRSSNPTIKNLNNYCSGEDLTDESKVATYKGVALKAVWYAVVTILSAVLASVLLFTHPAFTVVALSVSVVGALICSLISSFVPRACAVSGTLYVIFEGFAVGAVSALFDLMYAGIVLAALMSTVITLGVMMTLYATGIIRVGGGFRKFMISALTAICLCQLVMFIVGLISPAAYYLFYGNGFFAILASVIMVLFAAFFILIDLSNITMIVDARMDKALEWRAAFGLTVTLIWLYVEFLRLLSLFASRKK